MAAESGGVPVQDDVPCAARGISELVTQLARENDIPFQDVSIDTVNVSPDELYSDCDTCDGIAKFRGGIEANQCLSVTSGLQSCIRSWIALHPETCLNDDGTLTSSEAECGGENDKHVCLAQFLLSQAEDGTVVTTIDRGICIIDLEDKKFQKERWSPVEDVVIDLGLMLYPEDENGEVLYTPKGRPVARQTDAEGIGRGPVGAPVEGIETEVEDND